MPARSDSRAQDCARKRRYDSQRAAREAALHAQRESGHDDIWEYACPICGGWHLGHDPFFEGAPIYGHDPGSG